MDYIKLIIFLFTNFAVIIFLVLAVMIKFEVRKKIMKKPDPVRGVDSNSEVVIGLTICAVLCSFVFTVPVIRDMPYLFTQNYAEANGRIRKRRKQRSVQRLTAGNYFNKTKADRL